MWRVDLTDPGWDESAAAALLQPAELGRARRAAPEVGRRRLLLRAALRVVAGRALGVPARQVPLTAVGGRPVVAARAGAPVLRVSCAASAGVGLVALSWDRHVGVDVQRHDESEARAAAEEGWLAPAELRALARLPPGRRWPAVTRCWTQKEAVLKGLGEGLHRPPQEVVTPVALAGRWGPWSLAPVPLPDGSPASLALLSPRPVPAVPVPVLAPEVLR